MEPVGIGDASDEGSPGRQRRIRAMDRVSFMFFVFIVILNDLLSDVVSIVVFSNNLLYDVVLPSLNRDFFGICGQEMLDFHLQHIIV